MGIFILNALRSVAPAGLVPAPTWLPVIPLAGAALATIVFLCVLVYFLAYGERKLAARLQGRIGPRGAGPLGLAQPLADRVKLWGKREVVPIGVDETLFRAAPALAFMAVFAAFIVIPWCRDLSIAARTPPAGVVFVLAMLFLEAPALIVAGMAARNRRALDQALRDACRVLAARIPFALSVICCVLVAGDTNPYVIARRQDGSILRFLVFHDPFNFCAFFIACVAGFAAYRASPMEMLRGTGAGDGYHANHCSGYAGGRFGLLLVSRYAELILTAAIETTLWLGAWYDPFGVVANLETASRDARHAVVNIPLAAVADALGVLVFCAKTFFLIYIGLCVRWIMPRPRFDQALHLCVKVLAPVAAVDILGAAVYLWLVDPTALPLVQRVTEIVLATATVMPLTVFAGAILWAAASGRRRRLAGPIWENEAGPVA